MVLRMLRLGWVCSSAMLLFLGCVVLCIRVVLVVAIRMRILTLEF